LSRRGVSGRILENRIYLARSKTEISVAGLGGVGGPIAAAVRCQIVIGHAF